MKDKPQLPFPEIIQKTVENWQEICRKLDAAIETVDLVKIQQIQSERNIENLIAAAGIGVGTASAAASAASSLVKDFTPFYPIKIDKNHYPFAEPLSNLFIVILFSIGLGWGVGWCSFKLLRSHRNN